MNNKYPINFFNFSSSPSLGLLTIVVKYEIYPKISGLASLATYKILATKV